MIWRMNVTIYALVDPRKPADIRYVGQAIHPAQRHLQHCCIRSNPETTNQIWIESLRAEGILPQMVILEVVEYGTAFEAESRHQKQYSNLNNDMFNGVKLATPKRPVGKLRLARAEHDRALIVDAMEQENNCIARAAKRLGVSRPTLYEQLAALGIKR